MVETSKNYELNAVGCPMQQLPSQYPKPYIRLSQWPLEGALDSRLINKFTEGIYFQDPDFTPLDIEFLRSRGFEVIGEPHNLNDHTAQNFITPETFTFVPCGNLKNLLEKFISLHHPALTISHTLQPFTRPRWLLMSDNI